MGLFGPRKLSKKERNFVDSKEVVFRVDSSYYPDMNLKKSKLEALLSGWVLKGSIRRGDILKARDTDCMVIGIAKSRDAILKATPDDEYVNIVVSFVPKSSFILPVTKGVYEIVKDPTDPAAFGMRIDDVFLIKQRGVVVTGQIASGCVRCGDAVVVNGEQYTVTAIDVIPNQVEKASVGMNVGLLLSTMDASLFHRGDRVCAAPNPEVPKPEAPKPTEGAIRMIVSDVFFVEGRGVILKGMVNGDGLKRGDVVAVSGKTQCVMAITKENSTTGKMEFVESAAAGEHVGCLIDSMNKDAFKRGDVATMAPSDAEELLDDVTFIQGVRHVFFKPWHQYDVLLAARGYGWDMMKEWADYAAAADLMQVTQVAYSSLDTAETGVTASYRTHGEKCQTTPELAVEQGQLSIAGSSKALSGPVKIVWINQTRTLRVFTLFEDETLIKKYVETLVRRTFGTDKAMKLGQPIPAKTGVPVCFDGNAIRIDSASFLDWKKQNASAPAFVAQGVIALTEKEPTLSLYEDGVKTQDYVLQTEGDEDFTGKFFHLSVRLGIYGDPAVPAAQIDGFLSDTTEERTMTTRDIGYRFEVVFLRCGGAKAERRRAMNKGQDLPMKALKYPGYTTPTNVRLMGVCPDCGKSFCFHGYAFYMAQSDVAYSDDGQDCCEIAAWNIDKDTWTYETEGKTFRYYNSFCCPHCGVPYIDYAAHPENKVHGVSGCVHLGREHYTCQ